MSVDYQSAQSSTGSSSVTVTKPASTNVGDLLVGVICTQNSISSAPSGWTLLTNKQDSGAENLYVYWIIATSTEVAATNFTWSSSSNHMAGGIIRINGNLHSSPLAIFASDDDVSTTTPTFTNSVTPLNTNSLILFCVGAGVNSGTTSGITVSNYAITTSNPTWTEAFDVTHFGSNGDIQCSVAYATRASITATGNSSATLSSARTSASIMLVVRPQLLTTQSETVSISETLKKGVGKVILNTSSVSDTLTDTKKEWHNLDKNSSSWNNLDKN